MAKEKSWLKNLIFEEPESEDKTKVQPEVKSVGNKVNSTPAANTLATSPVIAGISGKVDQTLLNKLSAVLDSQQMQGIDYIRFKKTVESLTSIQPDENLRFTTAYMALKATNPELSKNYLVETTDKYIGLMEQERKVGMQQLSALKEKGIDKKIHEVDAAKKKIEALKEEINRLEVFVSESSKEISQKAEEYASREADFNATVDVIVDRLQSDKTKIQTLIK